MTRDYQCILVDAIWHATQEQASPPVASRFSLNAGCWTICCKWATFYLGYERKRPDCKECLKHCLIDEEKHPERDVDLRPERIETAPTKRRKKT